MDKDNNLIFEAYLNESMPYPLFAKLAKHVVPKCSKEKEVTEPSIHDLTKEDPREPHLDREEEERRLDPKCWKGYHKQGTKMKGGVRVNNCVKNEQEEGEKIPSLNEFWKMLKTHDWDYDYSDDSSVWRRGQAQRKSIEDTLKAGGKEYQDLYDQFTKNKGSTPPRPSRNRDEQLKDQQIFNDLSDKLDDISRDVWSLDEDQVISATQLYKVYNPLRSMISKIKELVEDKSKSPMYDTVAYKGYKRLMDELKRLNF